ncbi:hypothetical protein DENIS_1042 [Desulfonema ishimotonii]|uniref:Protein BatD n=1 Tax=Desulfonema ishimotonii TaxID=45657 RepID=A0A401FT11_9BACT|nr:BatD family protein [Desulfonema ishimotonii]GBC60098.1 hypothetical protein DENIS_1042 [Desulfonema ishimotonii]
MKKIALSLFFVLMVPLMAWAGPEIKAFADRTRVALGESFRLTISVSGGDGEADISPVRDFRVVSQSASTHLNIVNGKASRRVDHIYTLMPLKTGQFSIPPLPVTSDGKQVYTEEIPIQVFNRPQQANDARRDVFVEARISTPEPYESQQMVYTFRLYQTVRIGNVKFQQPDFKGFTSEKIDGEKSYEKVIRGRQYHVTELNYLLMPLGPGPKTIAPAVLRCDIVRKSGRRRSVIDLFDDPFFSGGRLEPRIFRTDALKVTVRPLPPYPGDAPFSGLVGEFTLRSAIEKSELKVGDSITLSAVVQGRGNIMDAGPPEIPLSDAFKLYRDEPEADIRPGPDGYAGKKVFRTALVPVKPGTFTIPPLKLVFFDTRKGQYVSQSTQPFSLTVRPSQEQGNVAVYSAPGPKPGVLKKKVEFTGRDILPLKEDIDALKTQLPMPRWQFALFLLGPALICLLVRFVTGVTGRQDEPSRRMRARAENALRAAEKDVGGGNFLSQLYQAVISMILARAGTQGESLTCAEAEAMLRPGGCPPETAQGAARLLERIESARFGGLEMDESEKAALLTETRELLRSLMR